MPISRINYIDHEFLGDIRIKKTSLGQLLYRSLNNLLDLFCDLFAAFALTLSL